MFTTPNPETGARTAGFRRAAGVLVLVSALIVSLTPSSVASLFTASESDDLQLIYIEPLHGYLAPYAARCFHSSMDFHRKLFDYVPTEPVLVMLTDTGDYGGGRAGAIPSNNLSVDIAPLNFAFETLPPGERMNTVMNHELLHIVSMDQAAGSDLFFRKLFRGKVLPIAEHPETIAYLYLTAPRVTVPSWYQEGSAVFMETWMAGGLGRAQGAYDEMVFRSMVRDGTRFYDPVGLMAEGTRIDFQAGINAYLYGTRFLSYLAYHYSPEHVIRWIARDEGSKKYYVTQFRHVFGAPLEQVWREWIDWEHEFQRANLETIRQFPITPHTDLSKRALGSASRQYVDRDAGKIYVAFNYPGVVSHVGAIDMRDGSVEKIVEVKGPTLYTVTSLAFDPRSKTLFFTSDNASARDLRSVDPRTGKSRLLMRDARIGDLAFNRADSSLWGIRQFNGLSTVVRIAPPYDDWKQIHTFDYGQIPYDLDVSPDGTRLSMSFAEVNGSHSLRVVEVDSLLEGDTTPIAVVDFNSVIPSSFTFSDDGRFLYGSTYYTGVSNVFRYELATEQLEALSNSETGFFRPVPLEGDELLVLRYTGEGFVPSRIEGVPLEDVGATTFLGQQIVEKHPVVTEWVAESPASVDLEARTSYQGEYRPLKHVRLESIYPVIEGYRDTEAFGLSADFSDPMFVHRVSATASYSPDDGLPSDERLHAHVKYARRGWEVDLKYNDADFYDLFGPTKTSRKGYSAAVQHDRTLIRDEPRMLTLTVNNAFFGDLDRLPRYQNVDATFDRLLEGSAQLTYSNLRASLGAVDYEKGVKVDAIVGYSYVDNDLIPGFVGNFDFGVPLPIGNSSLWLRNSVGAQFGEQQDPFANFFFGGFGNNWVDHGSIKRYREFYSFPGAELNEIGGRNYAKTVLEWNLPPLLFRNLGTPSFYLTWARASLFAGGLFTNLDDSLAERKVYDVGAQVDFRITILSKLDMTLSVGYAQAFESGLDSRDEFMASLKILR